MVDVYFHNDKEVSPDDPITIKSKKGNEIKTTYKGLFDALQACVDKKNNEVKEDE